MKLLPILLIFLNFELIIFHTLADETSLGNSSATLETATGVSSPSGKISQTNSTLRSTKVENFDEETSTGIIPTNRTIEETTPQNTATLIPRETSITVINSTRETTTAVITSKFISETSIPTTAAFSFHEPIKNFTSDPAPKTTFVQKVGIFDQTLETSQPIKNFTSDPAPKTTFVQKINIFRQTLETSQSTTATLQSEKSTTNVTFPRDNSTNSISSQHPILGLTPAPKLTTVALGNLTKLPVQKISISPMEKSPTIETSTSEIFTKPISSQNATSILTPELNQPPKNTSISHITTRITKPRKTTRNPTNKTRSKKKQKGSKFMLASKSPKTKPTFSRISRTYTKREWTDRTNPTFKEIDYRESNEFGKESFQKFMIRTSIYVDKSLLIKKFLDHPCQVILLTRPRYWGKSLNLNMLRKFFEIEVDLEGNILSQECQKNRKMFCGGHIYNESYSKTFGALKIANIPEAMEHQGKHPVIQLNYHFIQSGRYEETKMGMRFEIIRSFKKHFYLETYFKSNPDLLDDSKRSEFERYCNGNLTTEDLTHSIRFLSELLYKYFNQTVFVLIDEYDAPLAEAFRQSSEEPKNLEDMLNFYRLMYASAFTNNVFLAKAFITGKLRIENSNLFANLGNMAEYTLLDHEFGEFYGFTEQEVDELLKLAPNETAEEIKDYYRGYNYGGQIMYNPWSIKQCIENNYRVRAYWIHTGILVPAHRPRFSLEGVQQDIKTLLSYGSVHIPIKNEVTFNGLEDRRNFLNLILFTGYLSPAARNPNGTYELVKPNKEANYFYSLLLGSWIEKHFQIFGRWGVTIPKTSANATTISPNITRAGKKSRFGLASEDGGSTGWSTTQLHSSGVSFSQSVINFTRNISESFEKYNVTPQIIPVAPRKLVRVFFKTGELKPEAVLKNEDTCDQPTLHWDADDNSYYTLYLITHQRRENCKASMPGERMRYHFRPQWHNWIVVNIPANNVSSGKVLYDYVAPRNPLAYADATYYVSFLIYKQAKGITEFEPWNGDEWQRFVQYSPVVDFAANYSLGDPEFGNLFIMERLYKS